MAIEQIKPQVRHIVSLVDKEKKDNVKVALNPKIPKIPKEECTVQHTIDRTSYLKIANCFSEFTESLLETVRKNLGVEQLTANSVQWGNLIGDIQNQPDLLDLIANNRVDLSEYATKDYVEAARQDVKHDIRDLLLNYYADKAYVDQRIVNIASGGEISLDGYPTKQEVDDKIKQVKDDINKSLDDDYATDEELNTAISTLESKIVTDTKDLTNGANFVSKDTQELTYYPLKSEMESAIKAAQLNLGDDIDQDALTAALKDVATKTYVNEEIGKVTKDVSDKDEALTKALADGLKSVNDKIDGITVPEKLSDLTNDSGFISEELIDLKIEAVKVQSGGGVPIYDSEMINLLGDDLPNKYISIPTAVDLTGEVTEKTYTTSKNSNYMDILFSALRELQSEVAKLRNSFRYGINSYTGTNTAMSHTLEDYSTNVDDEPLWAVEESDLSLVSYLTLGEGCELIPATNVDVTNSGKVVISGDAVWEAPDAVKDVTDPKLFLYLQTTNLKIIITLTDSDDNEVTVNLEDLQLNICELYNYLFVLSRTVNNKGLNYIWISVSNDATDNAIAEGYLNGTTLQSNVKELSKAYTLKSVSLSDMSLSKFDVYSKYQDFSKLVIPSKPVDNDYKLEAAHITIRSCTTLDIATSVVDQLLENELVFISGTKSLYIKSNGLLVPVGTNASSGGDNPIINTGMTELEVLQLLLNKGYVAVDENGDLKVNSISELDFITFVNSDTLKEFKFTCDAYGNLTSQELNEEDSLYGKLKVFADEDLAGSVDKTWDPSKYLGVSIRGAIGQIGAKYYTKVKGNTIDKNVTKDLGLYTDRLKIGAVYIPYTTDTIFGCSHAYVELENTSDKDINLKGIRLYYKFYEPGGTVQKLEHLDLTGTIKAGSTYLIRGKQYAQFDDANCFIKVETYDQEWYDSNGDLIDFTFEALDRGATDYVEHQYGLALIYQDYYDVAPNITKDIVGYDLMKIFNTIDSSGNKLEFSPSTYLCTKNLSTTDTNGKTTYPQVAINEGTITLGAKYYYLVPGYYVDARCWTTGSSAGKATYDNWQATNFLMAKGNSILKNTFMLDPAKQAFLSNTTADSSRYREESKATDVIQLQLNKEYISFPNSPETYPVSNYTPKASYEDKNVLTDKTKLDRTLPNMVSCFFGIDTYTTRCFNWISAGLFDEYVWLKQADGTWKKFESYKTGSTIPTSTTAPYRKGYSADINNAAYARITRRFPGNGTLFTSHKCIIKIVDEAVSTPTTFTYVIGRPDSTGKAPGTYCSEEYTFTLYPTSYAPRIYQTSDQQGFHWLEYQVWNGVAKLLQKKMDYDVSAKNIVPILINTGDSTQNGTRINEWLDYYNAGKNLFKKYEQLNVVGNNDLCDTNPDILGTGDDIGKSNSYFFHLFNCYEINSDNAPIVNGVYIPSFYYNDWSKFRLIMLNSEITKENCLNWFKIYRSVTTTTGEGENIKTTTTRYPLNIYTGWEIGATDVLYYGKTYSNGEYSESGFKTVYSMLYEMMDDSSKERIVVACHEMPYTVITHANITKSTSSTQEKYSRSANATTLSGSHTNQIDPNDKMSINWFSRMCEYFNRKHRNVKLVLGGHKHTYTSTYPVRELFYFNVTSNVEPQVAKTEVVIVKGEGDNPDTTETKVSYYSLDGEETNTSRIVGYKKNTKANEEDPDTYTLLCESRYGFDLYEMEHTLENDTKVYWTKKAAYASIGQEYKEKDAEYHLTKFPLTRCFDPEIGTESGTNDTDQYYPYTFAPELEHGIVYFMDLASGYKLTSNKELPSPSLKFSYLIPKTIPGTASDTASVYQQRPMVIITRMEDNKDYEIELIAAFNVMTTDGKFTLFKYATGAPFFAWYDPKRDWVSSGYNNDFNPWYPHKDENYVYTYTENDETKTIIYKSNDYSEDNAFKTVYSKDTPIFAPNGANESASVAMDYTEDHTTLSIPLKDKEANFYHRKKSLLSGDIIWV